MYLFICWFISVMYAVEMFWGMVSTTDVVRSSLQPHFTCIRFHSEHMSWQVNTWWLLSLNREDNPLSLNVHYFSYVKIYLNDSDLPLCAHENIQSHSHVRTHTVSVSHARGSAGCFFFLVRIFQTHNRFFQLHLQSSLFKTALHPNCTLIWLTEACMLSTESL